MATSTFLAKDKKKMAQELQKLLANHYAVYTKTLKFHWNVQGPFFNDLHAFFKKLYETLLDASDTIAERIRALEVNTIGTLEEFKKLTSIKEQPGTYPDAQNMIKILLADYMSIIEQMRECIALSTSTNDAASNNMLSDMLEEHEKTAWMLRSLLLPSV